MASTMQASAGDSWQSVSLFTALKQQIVSFAGMSAGAKPESELSTSTRPRLEPWASYLIG